MQTPAPVDYARAHSVDEALELLERYGPESRLIAGGHSLIPMMRLRIAQPECVIDINDLDRTGLHPSVARRRPLPGIGAMTRHRTVLESGRHRRALPDLPRRGAGDRRSDRPQPGHGRRVALPGRPGRGPLRRRGRPARRPGHPVRSGTRTVPAREFTDGPYRHRARTTPRSSTEVQDSHPARGRAARTRRSSGGPATGPSPRPAPTWCWTATRSPTSGSGWPPLAPTTAARRTPRSTCWAGISPTRPSPRPVGWPPPPPIRAADQRGPVVYKSHLADELTQRVLRRAADRARRPARQGGADMQVSITVNGDRAHRRGRTAIAARALPPRQAGAHRNALGLRHLAVRHLRCLAGRGTGEDLHGAGRDGRRAPRAHRGGPGHQRHA